MRRGKLAPLEQLSLGLKATNTVEDHRHGARCLAPDVLTHPDKAVGLITPNRPDDLIVDTLGSRNLKLVQQWLAGPSPSASGRLTGEIRPPGESGWALAPERTT